MQRQLFRMLWVTVLLVLFAGCSLPNLGIRPDEPKFMIKDTTDCKESAADCYVTACTEYVKYANYSKELQEAYLSRATQNRFWIYASGATALGTIATTAGLAAASSPGLGTLAVISISGGLASGLFAVADNPTLADIYTTAANTIETTVNDADALLKSDDASGSRYKKDDICLEALKILRQGVTQAKCDLERARTDSAIAALQRAINQKQKLNELMDKNKPPK